MMDLVPYDDGSPCQKEERDIIILRAAVWAAFGAISNDDIELAGEILMGAYDATDRPH